MDIKILMGCACCKHEERDPRKILNNIIKSERIVIFSKTTCTFCDDSKRIFQMTGSDYGAVELDDLRPNEGLIHALMEKTGRVTVPQIFIDGKFIGGICELIRLRNSGVLYQMLCHNNPMCITTTHPRRTNVDCIPKAVYPPCGFGKQPCKIVCLPKEKLKRPKKTKRI